MIYGIPARAGPAAAGSLGVEAWLCGVAASHARWPPGEYSIVLPPAGLPLYAGHAEKRVVPSGVVDGDVGAARYFAEVDGIGLVTLIEVSAEHPSLLWDVAAGRRNGLSIGYCLDEPPGGGPQWLYVREVSLTDHPADPRAGVVSSGQQALDDWTALTGEPAPIPAG